LSSVQHLKFRKVGRNVFANDLVEVEVIYARDRNNARFMLIETVIKYYSRNLERKFMQIPTIMHCDVQSNFTFD